MEPLYRGHIGTLETVLYIEVVRGNSPVEPLYRGHIGTLETVLYIEVVHNSEASLNICMKLYTFQTNNPFIALLNNPCLAVLMTNVDLSSLL